MLTIGQKFPAFSLKAVKAGAYIDNPEAAFFTISNQTYAGKWKVFFFYPKDFTFVCPTEIEAFGNLNSEFENRNAALITGSTDSEFVHLAWKKDHQNLNNLPIPMLADVGGRLCNALGILHEQELVANRATFIVDPEDNIRFVSVTDLSVGRNPEEVLRVLDALQTGALTPCNWKKGQKTL